METEELRPNNLESDVHFTTCVVLTLVEPQSGFGDKLLGIRANLAPKRECGGARVEGAPAIF